MGQQTHQAPWDEPLLAEHFEAICSLISSLWIKLAMAHQYRDSGSGDSSVGQANPGDLTLPPRGMRVVVLSIQHSGGHMGQQTHQAP